MDSETKPWYQSKTVWGTIVAFAATIGTITNVDLGLDAATQTELVGGIMAIVNVALRMVTAGGLSLTSKQ